ncbi:HAMP domain-containing protein [Paenibacillus sp. SAF-068]|uniref:HAMP domain-containing protein n=1 Tax=Paenibacillus sp. SAF-068 TaxID=3436864 RepID=UPI003F802C77
MKNRFSTVRLGYIYIGGASALLSAALLFVVYHVLRFAHRHVLPDTAWITGMMNWGINHIGTKPFFLFIGGAVFAIFFWIRTQQIAEDLSQLARGTAELALGQNPGRIDVLSGGELRQIAANLNTIAVLLHEGEDKENAQAGSTLVDLPIKLTLYGIQSSLDEIIQGRCQDETEVQHWVKLAYEQTLLLHQALEITQRDRQEHEVSIERIHKEPEC